MPHGDICPYADCARAVSDWFVEWYPPAQQREIAAGRLAMDCSWCGRPVVWQKLRLLIALAEIPVEVRSYQQATRYAQSPPYSKRDLETFLMDATEAIRGEPFRKGYWPNVNLP